MKSLAVRRRRTSMIFRLQESFVETGFECVCMKRGKKLLDSKVEVSGERGEWMEHGSQRAFRDKH